MRVKKTAHFTKKHLDRFRHSLAGIDALPQLTFLGVVIGLCSGALIVVFRLLIDLPLQFFLPDNAENFEGLPSLYHFLLPFIGSVIIGLCVYRLPKKYHDVSVGHVLERLHNFQGRLPLGNVLVQFFGGAICLLSGQSVGREGPAIHIGASAASLLGQWLKLPNNSLRTLIGCGVAAAIAASFNTPVAGVIFAMEVVLMSYSIVGFIPVMIASVCGAFVTQLVFGKEFLFSVTDFQMQGLWELLILVVAGFIIGILATLYMRLQLSFHRFSHYPLTGRVIAAGFLTGCIALAAPEILGLGYDTVNLALEGKLAISALLLILFAKLIATAFSVSMGLPGGLIGPQLFIGACIGAIIGAISNGMFPGETSHSGFYVLLGMAAMMGAVINAPLAALMAILELTSNPSIIFPSMLVIVISCLTTRQLFKCDGIFVEQLCANGKSLDSGPTQQILSNIGVRSVMKTAFVECAALVTQGAAIRLLNSNPLWIVITLEDQGMTLLRAADLASYLSSPSSSETPHIDLLEIPAERLSLSPINERATLYEAQQMLSQQHTDAVYVTGTLKHQPAEELLGIITRNTIDNHYRL